MNVPAHVRHAADRVILESYDVLGYNYRMTDIQGAIGREQLRRPDGIVSRRRSSRRVTPNYCAMFAVSTRRLSRNGHEATGRVIASVSRHGLTSRL